MSILRLSKWVYIGIAAFFLASVPIILLIRPGLGTIVLAPWQDWAQISDFHKANAKLIASPDPERVIFFGDSHIGLWRTADNFPGRHYVNRGIGGQTTAQMLVRFRADVIALKPRVVLILGGSNDVLIHWRKLPFEQTVDNYASMAELARENDIKVIFAAVPPVNREWTTRLEQPDRIRKINEWLKNYCTANRFIYLDYYDQLADANGMLKAELSIDGLHLNPEGYKVVSRLAEAAIESTRTRSAKN
jgi:lysophospholipase L1-like esterase